ncbi:hypothetical protein [Candidatus Leptofilum sp.]|uniref:hypothetical protein n=1 Tax=Candidatus Leptofilum sp. TaxID=3241576 RepID=UPI003B58C726
MNLTLNSILVLWGAGIMLSVLLFWSALRFALSTCDADNMTRGLAGLFCLLLLLAGLALGVILSSIPA